MSPCSLRPSTVARIQAVELRPDRAPCPPCGHLGINSQLRKNTHGKSIVLAMLCRNVTEMLLLNGLMR
eukprot:s2441_g6.t1